MLVSVVDGSRPLARIAGAFRGGGSVSVHVGPPGALAHIAERRRGTIAGACRGERPVWPVPASWAEASVSLSSFSLKIVKKYLIQPCLSGRVNSLN